MDQMESVGTGHVLQRLLWANHGESNGIQRQGMLHPPNPVNPNPEWNKFHGME